MIEEDSQERLTDVRKLHGILDEEDRNVVSHDVPVTLLSVEFDGKASDIAHSVCTPSRTQDCRESQKDWSGTGGIGKYASFGDIGGTFVELESPEGTDATGMDDTFRDTLMVESVDLGDCQQYLGLEVSFETDLLPPVTILEQRRTVSFLCGDRKPMIGVADFTAPISSNPSVGVGRVNHVL